MPLMSRRATLVTSDADDQRGISELLAATATANATHPGPAPGPARACVRARVAAVRPLMA